MAESVYNDQALRKLEVLEGTIQRMRLQIKHLDEQVNDEGVVLRQLLEQKGIIRTETFLAQLHRTSFNRRRQASHFVGTIAFDDVIRERIYVVISTVHFHAPP